MTNHSLTFRLSLLAAGAALLVLQSGCATSGGAASTTSAQQPSQTAVPIKKNLGYTNTPMIPGTQWHVHDGTRPQPRIVTSGYVADGSLDMAFDFDFGPAARGAARHGDAATLTTGIAELADRYRTGGVATFLTNHDQARAMTELRGNRVAAGLAGEALLTSPGVPFIYYGEELGLQGAKPDEDIRTPFPWTPTSPGFGFTTGSPWEPFGPDPQTANVASESDDAGSLLTTYRTMLNVRNLVPVLATGDAVRVDVASRDLAVTLRWEGSHGALVIQNLGDRPAESPILNLASGPICGQPHASVVYQSGPGSETLDAADPVIGPAGRLTDYVPLPRVPAFTTVVITLNP